MKPVDECLGDEEERCIFCQSSKRNYRLVVLENFFRPTIQIFQNNNSHMVSIFCRIFPVEGILPSGDNRTLGNGNFFWNFSRHFIASARKIVRRFLLRHTVVSAQTVGSSTGQTLELPPLLPSPKMRGATALKAEERFNELQVRLYHGVFWAAATNSPCFCCFAV